MTFAYRGEDGPSAGKSGRTPAEVRTAGGFKPWRADSLVQARANLQALVANGTLATEAEKWCLGKNRENGWFFSTGTDEGTAYDNYDHFYRIAADGLVARCWADIGMVDQRGMALWLDADTLDAAGVIAVIWKVRPKELLIMSPVATGHIAVRDKTGDWVPMDD